MKSSALAIVTTFLNILYWSEGSLTQPELNGGNAALIYLSRYGYIDPAVTNSKTGSLQAEEAVNEAIKSFQAFAGLNQTGRLNDETVEMMNTPRCGVVDKVGYGSNVRRKKRYALQGSRWKVTDLSYKITKYPKKLSKAKVDYDIEKSFKVWSDITELTFSKAKPGHKVHIDIRFERGEHGDGDPFDGLGGTLAHAYFPIYGGDAHFDESETWTVDSYRGTNLLQVAAHEFGHSLGLSHSDVQSALMAPFYRGYEPNIDLDEDDIKGIQSLYGKKPTEKYPKTSAPKPTVPFNPSGEKDSALCSDGSFDAIVAMEDKMTYVFKASQFWKLSDEGVEAGYPRKIKSVFKGLPSNLDAAFTWNNGKTYFFKGSKYWRSTGFKMDEGYPKLISKGFAGIPNSVNAAFIWSGNGKIYFVKGSRYYKFDPTQRPPVASKYPADFEIWEGLPSYIDDALQYTNGFTYFFKRGKYWRFNDRGFKVDADDPPYPRAVGPWWFGCPQKGNQENDIDSSQPKPTPDLRNEDDDTSNTDTDWYYDDYYGESNVPPRFGYMDKSGVASGQRSSPDLLGWLVLPLLLTILYV